MEVWATVAENDRYEVSSTGRVRSLDRKIISSDGKPLSLKGIFLKESADRRGYSRVVLCENRKRKHRTIHRLVATAFIPNPENKRTINHKNGIKSDNRVENLEWATDSENAIHAFETGLRFIPSGIGNANSKKVAMMDDNFNVIKIFDCIRDAERETGVPNQNISKVCNGFLEHAGKYRWKHTIQ